ncbi:3-beta hydroxysteroid dehydrogenase/isomerase family-domain-containing protein [Kockiozyma suomiensis]|uniref:3-beta hydroxysteroid dehydrogenase/isomerase family-domain-containing protein n=1 Tax=Kockiozyma suomiensis TaxID=1337062 RepID=UPI0033437027
MALSTVLIIGGSGFLGCHLVDRFYAVSPRPAIHVLDIRPLPIISPEFYSFNPDEIVFHKGDITDPDSLREIYREVKPDIIVHSASPIHGMGKEIYYKVNVDGTQAIIDVAVEPEFADIIKGLVYTSSASVIYNGEDLRNADETTPMPEKQMDAYNETKALGEKMVLAANNKRPGFKTVALRPSAMFGPGDRQLIPNMVQVGYTSGTRFQIGNNWNIFDFTYIGNVAHAHVLAAQKLLDEKKSGGVAGEPFIITNNQPVYFFTVPRKVWAMKGNIPSFTIKISRPVGFFLAFMSEVVAKLRGKEALFTRFRVSFTCANRYFNISKAIHFLEYKPIVTLEKGIEISLRYLEYEEEEKAKTLAEKKSE